MIETYGKVSVTESEILVELFEFKEVSSYHQAEQEAIRWAIERLQERVEKQP